MQSQKAKHALHRSYQIDELWSEFDSGAWLVNLGVFTPPSANTKREEEEEALAPVGFEA
jgi:hypothetical protein